MDSPPFRQAGEIGERQDGVISVAQLREIGFTEAARKHRLLTRQFVPIHRGVYAFGHRRLGPRGLLWAAHLATGGVVSHASAAWAWALIPPPALPVHVTTSKHRRRRDGIWPHQAGHNEITYIDGLPVTTIERTLADLPPRLRARATREARYLRLIDPEEAAPRIRSPLEHRFLDICERHGIPAPLINDVVDGRERDFYWPRHRLVVETDGAQHAWADDRRRDRDLFVRTGITTLRFTSHDGDEDVARTVNAALDRLRTLS